MATTVQAILNAHQTIVFMECATLIQVLFKMAALAPMMSPAILVTVTQAIAHPMISHLDILAFQIINAFQKPALTAFVLHPVDHQTSQMALIAYQTTNAHHTTARTTHANILVAFKTVTPAHITSSAFHLGVTITSALKAQLALTLLGGLLGASM